MEVGRAYTKKGLAEQLQVLGVHILLEKQRGIHSGSSECYGCACAEKSIFQGQGALVGPGWGNAMRRIYLPDLNTRTSIRTKF